MTKRINIIYHNFFRTICFCDELFRIFLYLEIEFFLICYSNNTHCKYTDTRTHLGFFYQHLHDHLFHLSISLAIRRFYIIMYIYICAIDTILRLETVYCHHYHRHHRFVTFLCLFSRPICFMNVNMWLCMFICVFRADPIKNYAQEINVFDLFLSLIV